MSEGMLHIRDVEGPKKTGSVETRLEAMEQQVFKCQGMVERGLKANHMMITEFTSNHKMDAIDIGKHLSRLYDRVDQLQGQIYDLQNQNYPSAPPTSLLPPKARAVPLNEAFKMQFYGPTFQGPPTVPERRYPANAVVEESLRVWAFSCWRGSTELARGFLRAGFHHLPAGSPPMFNLVEQRPHANAPSVGLVVHFTNRFDAYHLLGKVYWCGCEFIAFTTYNIFADFESIFPARDRMHGLPYHLGDDDLEEEEY
ncbi:Auxin-induced protein 5NG4 [Hordeum vulgare]|nr:Auxin-induced protein 5NG4 [Hordeum vulgare]